MTRRAAALLLAAVLVVPACTTRTADPAPRKTTTTTTTTTSSTPPAPTSAKDGTNVAACRDGVCEVRLTGRTVIPVNPAVGVTEVAVESIAGDEVTAMITLSGTHFDLNTEGDPRSQTSIVGTTPPVAYATAHPGARVLINKVALAIPAAADGTAILQLSRR
jgi:hypothetical protein